MQIQHRRKLKFAFVSGDFGEISAPAHVRLRRCGEITPALSAATGNRPSRNQPYAIYGSTPCHRAHPARFTPPRCSLTRTFTHYVASSCNPRRLHRRALHRHDGLFERVAAPVNNGVEFEKFLHTAWEVPDWDRTTAFYQQASAWLQSVGLDRQSRWILPVSGSLSSLLGTDAQ
jgi:hypothetical protein